MKQVTAQPSIVLTVADFERLTHLLKKYEEGHAAQFLGEELGRAVIAAPGEIGRDIAVMNSWLEYRDDVTGQTARVALAYPDDPFAIRGRISVLSELGAALVGLREGQSIQWKTRKGGWRSITLLKVLSQPWRI